MDAHLRDPQWCEELKCETGSCIASPPTPPAFPAPVLGNPEGLCLRRTAASDTVLSTVAVQIYCIPFLFQSCEISVIYKCTCFPLALW